MPSPMALLVIAIVVLVLFGRGKVSSLMGEFGKGITAFKKGINDGNAEVNAERPVVVEKSVQPVQPVQSVQPVPGTEARDVTPHNEPRL
jgi:sec-independent protein translocase protein TatA